MNPEFLRGGKGNIERGWIESQKWKELRSAILVGFPIALRAGEIENLQNRDIHSEI